MALTLNIICFLEKNNIFLRFCLCIFESDTVKSDCPMQIFRKIIIFKDLIQTVGFTVCCGKNCPPTLNLIFFPVNKIK